MNIETENLSAHVSLCQQRYAALQYRLDALETNLEKIEKMVQSIHCEMIKISDRNAKQWSLAQVGVIGILLSMVGYLMVRQFG